MENVTTKDITVRLLQDSGDLKKALIEYQEGLLSREEFSDLLGVLVKEQVLSGSLLPLEKDSSPLAFPEKGPPSVSPEDLLFGDEETGPKKLHPLYSAALAERLQFDEDAPELRTGPLPKGVRPAVPVKTSARNPVMIGAQLEKASENVLALIEEAIRKALSVSEEDSGESLMEYGKELEPSGYKRGSLPVPVTPEEIKTSELVSFSEEKKRQFAWKSISTTQGRRSVLEVLRNLVEKALDPSLFSFIENFEEREVEKTFEWVFQMSSEGDTQSNFCFVDICAGFFIHQMRSFQKSWGKIEFSIRTLDKIPDRKVGWRLDIFK